LVDVGNVVGISWGRYDSEEVVLLLKRQSIRNDVRANSDEGWVSSLGYWTNWEGNCFELGEGNNAVSTVEVVSWGARWADGGWETSGALGGAWLTLPVEILILSTSTSIAGRNTEVLTQSQARSTGSTIRGS
jgi:hypothetical protein